MGRYMIEEAKYGYVDFGPDAVAVATVKYNDGRETRYLSLAEVSGIPNFLLTKEDIFDKLMDEDDSDPNFWDGINDLTIFEFNGINISVEYSDAISSIRENEDNPAAPLLRYIIALVRNEETQQIIDMGTGKYADELDIPLSDVEEDIIEDEEDEA